MKLFAIMAICCLGLAAWSKPAAAGPLLCPADLDSAISALPLRVERDPVDHLKQRLQQLDSRSDPGPERLALRQALGIIRLARTTRLTTEPPSQAGEMLAGL